jgi:hypothetical protein
MHTGMTDTPRDVYAQHHPIDFNTLANLGPLRGPAGVWQGTSRPAHPAHGHWANRCRHHAL